MGSFMACVGRRRSDGNGRPGRGGGRVREVTGGCDRGGKATHRRQDRSTAQIIRGKAAPPGAVNTRRGLAPLQDCGSQRGCLTLARREVGRNVKRNAQWEGELREMVSDFIALKAEARDEAALTWVFQRVIMELVGIGISPDTILRRVREALPQ